MSKIKIQFKAKEKVVQPAPEAVPSEKLKLVIKNATVPFIDSPAEIPEIKAEKTSLRSHIKQYFSDPLQKLIDSNGENENGIQIANVDALMVVSEILSSILDKKEISIVEIFESHALSDCENDSEIEDVVEDEDEVLVDIFEENIEEEEEEEDSEDDEDEDEEYEEEDYEEDLEEARECDSYMYSEDESMDG